MAQIPPSGARDRPGRNDASVAKAAPLFALLGSQVKRVVVHVANLAGDGTKPFCGRDCAQSQDSGYGGAIAQSVASRGSVPISSSGMTFNFTNEWPFGPLPNFRDPEAQANSAEEDGSADTVACKAPRLSGPWPGRLGRIPLPATLATSDPLNAVGPARRLSISH